MGQNPILLSKSLLIKYQVKIMIPNKQPFSKWHYRTLPILFLIISSTVSFAQDTASRKTDTSGTRRAIYWIKKGQHDKAKKICQDIMLTHPNDLESKVLLGRLYSWDKQFDSARIVLQDVVTRDPGNQEALNALINVELWSGKFNEGLELCQKALSQYPNSENLLLKKAKIYNKQGKYKEASLIVDRVLELNPVNQEALQFRSYLKQKLAGQVEKNGIGAFYQYDQFNNSYSPWNYASLYFFHKGNAGMITGSFNYTNRLVAS